MFVHQSKRGHTGFNIAAILIGALFGFPYLLCTVHFYVKPPRLSRDEKEASLQKRLDALR
jgi:hypothetical protein